MVNKIIKIRTILILIAIVFLFLLVYNQLTNNITDLLTGNVAITSNALNDESPNNNSGDFNKINLSLILIMVVAIFMFVRYMKGSVETEKKV